LSGNGPFWKKDRSGKQRTLKKCLSKSIDELLKRQPITRTDDMMKNKEPRVYIGGGTSRIKQNKTMSQQDK
jgi:hypothetical protein